MSGTSDDHERPTHHPSKQPALADSCQQQKDDWLEDDGPECWADANEDIKLEDNNSHNANPPLVTDLSENDTAMDHNGSQTTASHQNNKLCTDPESLKLHEAVFKNDRLKIYELLKDKQTAKDIINIKDKHGNTPLHLACMLGRCEWTIKVLLRRGASIDCKNLNRWTPFHEACSYGNRDIILLMTKQLQQSVCDALTTKPLLKNLEKTRNYNIVLKWEFQSWVPFLARVLPSDTCVIRKQGRFVRIDTKLLGFETISQNSSLVSLIYNDKYKNNWVIVNWKEKTHFPIIPRPNKNDSRIEDKVDEFMSTDIMDFELLSDDIQLTRSTKGWIWKADKVEKICSYKAALYDLNNVFLVTRKRREHLTEEDIKRNKTAYKNVMQRLKFGKKANMQDLENVSSQEEDGDVKDNSNNNRDENTQEEDEKSEGKHRNSLPPPPECNVTWEEYCQAEPGKHPTLGREQVCKVVKTAYKASVAMSEEFPITKNEFVDLLSIVPLKLFKKLKEFIELRFPEGFPVRLDIPIFPFLTARITFEDFAFHDGPIDESLFDIPEDFDFQDTFPTSKKCRQRKLISTKTSTNEADNANEVKDEA